MGDVKRPRYRHLSRCGVSHPPEPLQLLPAGCSLLCCCFKLLRTGKQVKLLVAWRKDGACGWLGGICRFFGSVARLSEQSAGSVVAESHLGVTQEGASHRGAPRSLCQ